MAYKDSAPFYDLFASENDIAYHRELGLEHQKALEIGVGTARVALELAKAGVEVLGIDNSPHMLKEAEKKLERETETVQKLVRLFEADMRRFNLNRTFPLVYIPSSTMQHCTTQEDHVSCVETINEHLSRDGLLAFNLTLPRAAYNNNLRLIGKAKRNGTTIFRFIAHQLNWQEQLLEVLLLFESLRKRENDQTYLRYLYDCDDRQTTDGASTRENKVQN